LQGSCAGVNTTGPSPHNVTPEMGGDPFILRETLEQPIGAALYIYVPSPDSYPGNPGFGDSTIKLYKSFHMTAGEVDLNQSDNIYGATTGAVLTASNSLNSTPQVGTEYALNRPYEYIEFLVEDRIDSPSFSSDFVYSGISAKWEDFFGTSRDDSGFVVHEELTLDKFMDDYLQKEPFTVYIAEDGTYQFKMFKKTYSDGDEDGTLDYEDAIDFNISLTSSKNLHAEIKNFKTDYVYAAEEYSQDINWKLTSGTYDYTFWKFDNSFEKNSFQVSNIEKKYTSYTPVDTVTYGGVHWGCARTNINQTPAVDSLYWKELNEEVAGGAWSDSTDYLGEDAEQYHIASWLLNQWGNRHRMVEFKTDNLEYLKYSVGDIVQYTNVPFSLVGMDIKGFNDASNFESSINGQTVYAAFIITNIQKSLKSVTINAMQLHKLDDYEIERIN